MSPSGSPKGRAPGATSSCMKPQRILHHAFELKGNRGDVIRGDVRSSQDREGQPVLVIAHGFKVFKDWGPYPSIGEQFAKAGFVSVVFNFSHNGVGRDLHRISDFERFAKNTITQEVGDLGRVIDAVVEGRMPLGPADKRSVAVVGHSRGAGVAIVRAWKDRRIRAVAAWSAVSTFDRWTERQKQEWRERGYLSLVGPKLKPTFRMGVEFLDDLDRNRQRLDIEKAVSELHVPLLLVYGKQDLVTPVAEAEKLYAKSDRTKTELVIVENTGHMLGGGTSPFRGSSVLDHIIDLTSSWLGRNLAPGRKPDADT